jgi:hypothetical protein
VEYYVVSVTESLCNTIWYLLQGECIITVCGAFYRESVLLHNVVPVSERVCYYGKRYLLQGECVTMWYLLQRESVITWYLLQEESVTM